MQGKIRANTKVSYKDKSEIQQQLVSYNVKSRQTLGFQCQHILYKIKLALAEAGKVK